MKGIVVMGCDTLGPHLNQQNQKNRKSPGISVFSGKIGDGISFLPNRNVFLRLEMGKIVPGEFTLAGGDFGCEWLDCGWHHPR